MIGPCPGLGAVQLNCAESLSPVTDAVAVNEPGGVDVVMVAADAGPVSPLAFVADTVKL